MGGLRRSDRRPELSIVSDEPQPSDIDTFNQQVLRRPTHVVKVLSNMLAGKESGVSELGQEVRAAAQGILDSSDNGRLIEYDDFTWGWVMGDPGYQECVQRLRGAGSQGEKLEAAHTAVALRGLIVYAQLSEGHQRSLSSLPESGAATIPPQPLDSPSPVVTEPIPDYT